MWYGDGYDIDQVVRRLYTGELDYATFVSQVVIHPAFYGLHQGDDWPAKMLHVFIGRTARADEIAGLRALTRIFGESRVFCDGAIWSDTYDEAVSSGLTGQAAIDYANVACVDAGSKE